MKYYTFHIHDSGAIEFIDYEESNGESIAICTMYDDADFNRLNDILHSTGEYIINKKALAILKEANIIPYSLKQAKVLRKEKMFGFLRRYKSYNGYYEFSFSGKKAEKCYDWIDFEKSEIFAMSNLKEKFKIYSHQETLDFIKLNKSNSGKNYSLETTKIVFGENFNTTIDLFEIPLYSWGHYISERLMNKLITAGISDIGFADGKDKLGHVWKPHFPIIEFDM